MKKPGTKVWLDVETTGLADTDKILEVGIVITGDDNVELAAKEWLVAGVTRVPDRVYNMHKASGLWDALEEAKASGTLLSPRIVEEEICAFIEDHCVKGRAALVGNSIQFDQRMLRNNMPKVLDSLHYRLVDVSTLRRVFRDETAGAVDPGKPDCPHRALADVRVCMQEYKDLLQEYNAWVLNQ